MSNATDAIDRITPEERNALKAYCEIDETWWNFLASDGATFCPICGAKPCNQVGFQIMTQRTYQPLLHGKKKIKKKK